MYREEKVSGVRATSGSRLGDICLHSYGQSCASRGAAVTVIFGKDSDAPKQRGKVSAHPDKGKDKSMQQSWRGVGTGSSVGKPAHSQALDLQLLTGFVMSRLLREGRRAACSVNNPSETHGKTKIHIPMSAWSKKEGKKLESY